MQIGLCDGPCIKAISAPDYDEQISHAKQVLRGDTKELISELESEMKVASKAEAFEQAKDYRDQIIALKRLDERQSVERGKERQEDVIHYLIHEGIVSLMLFHVRSGLLLERQEFEFEEVNGWLEEFMVQYYSENQIPPEIILPTHLNDEGIAEFLSLKKGKAVTITIPKQGEKKELLELAMKNIELNLFKNVRKLEALKNAISLEKLPHVIECFDISHLGGTSGVGSMVQFREGTPDKSNYRRFKIKSFVGNDDYRAISEVVRRRYSRLKAENSPLPDLVVIDGGRGQLNAAAQEIKTLGLPLTVISLAKQFEEIYLLDSPDPLRLERKDEGLKMLQAIRDEAHRFAITYNRLLRSKKMKEEFSGRK